jgi:hypothetical protein
MFDAVPQLADHFDTESNRWPLRQALGDSPKLAIQHNQHALRLTESNSGSHAPVGKMAGVRA